MSDIVKSDIPSYQMDQQTLNTSSSGTVNYVMAIPRLQQLTMGPTTTASEAKQQLQGRAELQITMESAQLLKINGKEYALIRARDPSGKEHQFLLPSDLSVETLGRYIAVSSPSGSAHQPAQTSSQDQARPTLPSTSGATPTTNIWSLENSNWTPKLGTDLDSKWLQRIETDYISSLSQSATRSQSQQLSEFQSTARNEPQQSTSIPQVAAKVKQQDLSSPPQVSASFSQSAAGNEPQHMLYSYSSHSVTRNQPQQSNLKQLVTTAKLPNILAKPEIVSKPKPTPVLLKSVKSPTESSRAPTAIGRLDANKKLVFISPGFVERPAVAGAMKPSDTPSARTVHCHIDTPVSVTVNSETTNQTAPYTEMSPLSTSPVYKSKLEKAIAQNNMNIANSHCTTTPASSSQNESLGTLKRLLNSKAMTVSTLNQNFVKGLEKMTSLNETTVEMDETPTFAVHVEVNTTPSKEPVVRKMLPLTPKSADSSRNIASGETYNRNTEQTLLAHINNTGSAAIPNPNVNANMIISNTHVNSNANIAISSSHINNSVDLSSSNLHAKNIANIAISSAQVNKSTGMAITNLNANNNVAISNNVSTAINNLPGNSSAGLANSNLHIQNSAGTTDDNLRVNHVIVATGNSQINNSKGIANSYSGTVSTYNSNTVGTNFNGTDLGHLTDHVPQFSNKTMLLPTELPHVGSSVGNNIVLPTSSLISEVSTYTTVNSNTCNTVPANNAVTRFLTIPTAVLEKVLKAKPLPSSTILSLPRAPPLKQMAHPAVGSVAKVLPSDRSTMGSTMKSTNHTTTNNTSTNHTVTNFKSTNHMSANLASINQIMVGPDQPVTNLPSTNHKAANLASTNQIIAGPNQTVTNFESTNETAVNLQSTNQNVAGKEEKQDEVVEMEYSDSCLQCLARDIMAGMWRLRENDLYCDAVLLARDEQVKLHKVVLAGVSPEMYNKVVTSPGDSVMRLQLPADITVDNLHLLVYYMYHGTVKLNVQNVQQLYRLTAVFNLEQLKKHCYDFCRLSRMGYLIISSPYQEAAKQVIESAKPSAKRRRNQVPLKDKQQVTPPPNKQPQQDIETHDKSPVMTSPRNDMKTPTEFEWLTSSDLDQSNMPIRKRVRTRRGLTATVASTASETVLPVNTSTYATATTTTAMSTTSTAILLSSSAVSLETAKLDKGMIMSTDNEKGKINSTEFDKNLNLTASKPMSATANLEKQNISPTEIQKRSKASYDKGTEIEKPSPEKSEPMKATIRETPKKKAIGETPKKKAISETAKKKAISETPKKKAVVQESLKEKLGEQASETMHPLTELPDPLASGKIDESELLKIVEEDIVTPTKSKAKVKASPAKTMVTRFRNRPKNMSVIEAASQKKAKSNDTSSVYSNTSLAKGRGKGKNQTVVKSPKSLDKFKSEQSAPIGKIDSQKSDQAKRDIETIDNTVLGTNFSYVTSLRETDTMKRSRLGNKNDSTKGVTDQSTMMNTQPESIAPISSATNTNDKSSTLVEKVTRKRLAAALAEPLSVTMQALVATATDACIATNAGINASASIDTDVIVASDASITTEARIPTSVAGIGIDAFTTTAVAAKFTSTDVVGVSGPDKQAAAHEDSDVRMAASPPKKARLRRSTTEQQQQQESPKDTVYMRPPPKKRTKEIREMMKHEEDTIVEEVKQTSAPETHEQHVQAGTEIETEAKLIPQPVNMDHLKKALNEEKKGVVKTVKKTSLRRDNAMVKQVYDIESRGKTIDGDKQYRCHLCNNVFSFARRVVNHLVSTHDILVEESSQYVTVEPKSANPKICDICGYKTKEVNIYYIHYHKYFRHGVPLPKGWQPFTCDLCKKEFFTKFQLRDHKLIHFEDNPFVCEVCGSGFKSRTCLNSHVFHKHSSVRRFACVECPKTFKTSTQLKVHKRIHSGDKPFACQYVRCTYRSTTRGNMRLHLVNRHKFDNDYVKEAMNALQPTKPPPVQTETEMLDTEWTQPEAEPSRYPASQERFNQERDLNEERAVEMASDPATLTTLVEAAVAEVNSVAGYQGLNDAGDGPGAGGMVPSLSHVDSMTADLMEQDHTGNQSGRDYDMGLVHSVQLVSGMGPPDHDQENANTHMPLMVQEEAQLQHGSDLMVRHQDQNIIELQNYHQPHGQHSMPLISLQEYREPDHQSISSQAYSISVDQRLDVSHHQDQQLDIPHQDQRIDMSHQMQARPRLDPDSREARMIVKEVLQGHEPRSLLKAAILQGSMDNSKLLRGSNDSGKLSLDSRSFVDSNQSHTEHQFPEENTLVIDTHPEQPQLVIADEQVLQGIRMQEPFRDSHSGVEMFRGGHSNSEIFRPSHSNAIFRGDNEPSHHQDLEQTHLQPFQSTSMDPPPSYSEQSHSMMTAIPVSAMSVSHAMDQGRYQGEVVQTVSLHHPGENQPQQQTSPQMNQDGSTTYGYYQQTYPIENF